MPDVFESKRALNEKKRTSIVGFDEEVDSLTKDYEGRVKRNERAIPQPKVRRLPEGVEKRDGKL